MKDAFFGAVVTGLFFSGAMWAQFKQLRRDINGLGRKMGKTQILMIANEADEAKRKDLARMILEA